MKENKSPQSEAPVSNDDNSCSVENITQALYEDAREAGCLAEPEIYYDINRKEYFIRNTGGAWMAQTETQIRRRLRSCGYTSKIPDEERISPLEAHLMEITDNNYVSYTGPLAGKKSGFYDEIGTRFLITESPSLIEPRPGSWQTLKSIFEAVLSDEEHDQLVYFYGWLKIALDALLNGEKSFGQALVLAGPAGSGKSLIQSLITMLLGGRSARPFPYMTGKTDFNSDLFCAEHLMIEDEAPGTDSRSRKYLGNSIKQFTVNEEHRMHAKRRDAITMKPFWRLSISLNDEPEDIAVLPPLDSGIEDKLILLKSHKRKLPLGPESIERKEQFRKKIKTEMPAFVHYLLYAHIIEESLRCERFGIRHFHHPYLLNALGEISSERKLLDFIEQSIQLPFEGRASDLEDELRKIDPQKTTKLLYYTGACGKYLERLSKQCPNHVQKKRKSSHNEWLITR